MVLWSCPSQCDGSSDQSFMVEQLSYFAFQPIVHNCCNKGRGVIFCLWGDDT